MSLIEWQDAFNDVFEDYPNTWKLDSVHRNKSKTSMFENEMQRTGYARFHCPKCSKGWASAKAMVVFYYSNPPGRSSGRVFMRLMGQQCRSCSKKAVYYADPEFEESFIQMTLAKLHERVGWNVYGKIRPPKQKPSKSDKEHAMKGPHEKNLCEACKLGICKQT